MRKKIIKEGIKFDLQNKTKKTHKLEIFKIGHPNLFLTNSFLMTNGGGVFYQMKSGKNKPMYVSNNKIVETIVLFVA